MSNGKRIFISHGVGDAVFAGRLAALMSDRGASVFLDTNIAPGAIWSETLRMEIEKASALVLLIPSDTVPNRNNLWFEAGAARALGKRVLGVLPPHGRMTELPGHIADILVLDADQRPIESIADTLMQAVPELAEDRARAN